MNKIGVLDGNQQIPIGRYVRYKELGMWSKQCYEISVIFRLWWKRSRLYRSQSSRWNIHTNDKTASKSTRRYLHKTLEFEKKTFSGHLVELTVFMMTFYENSCFCCAAMLESGKIRKMSTRNGNRKSRLMSENIDFWQPFPTSIWKCRITIWGELRSS